MCNSGKLKFLVHYFLLNCADKVEIFAEDITYADPSVCFDLNNLFNTHGKITRCMNTTRSSSASVGFELGRFRTSRGKLDLKDALLASAPLGVLLVSDWGRLYFLLSCAIYVADTLA